MFKLRLIFLFLIIPNLFLYSQPLSNYNYTPVNQVFRTEAPNLKFQTLFGGKVRLKDFRGKVVLIDAWASWCNPCLAAFPSLKIKAKKYQDRDVVFLTVNIEDQKKKWKRSLKDIQPPGVQLWGGHKKNPFRDEFAIYTLPRYILIDKQGRIAYPDVGSLSRIGGKIEELLRE